MRWRPNTAKTGPLSHQGTAPRHVSIGIASGLIESRMVTGESTANLTSGANPIDGRRGFYDEFPQTAEELRDARRRTDDQLVMAMLPPPAALATGSRAAAFRWSRGGTAPPRRRG